MVLRSVVLLLGSLLVASSAHAEAIIRATQDGSGVAFALTGALNLSGTTFYSSTMVYVGGFDPADPSIFFGPIPSGIAVDQYTFSGTTPDPFSNDFPIVADVFSGDAFFIGSQVPAVDVPQGYVSGSPLSSALVFLDETFETMGLQPGTYTWTLPSDSVVLRVVPESSTGALLGAAILGLACPVPHRC